ncbi:MAG: exodeoxyribonuclease VII large subunit [Burkholderiaceae bacterium]|nr:exodeoxyribonuclease VII large subunit [Burkholderiaceae bacterium]
MTERLPLDATPRIWQVGALCRAMADTLDARFNPVAVRGEISGFSRASSGHCYFSLKDASGQIRCAMFKRAASLTDFAPRDGDLVDVRGRIDIYTPRGDLQLIVESMSQAGQGALFEQFLRLKAKLEAEGLFAPERKRALPPVPRGIGLVTSLGAAALHDVVTALQRRVPHIPVVLSPAAVQGTGAPQELIKALSNLYQYSEQSRRLDADLSAKNGKSPPPHIDVILLVRGGGSMEDLWAFNDETLARTMAQSPVPIISGVGHETDFTIADFVADLRAPTPTAAAELVCQPREAWLGAVDMMQERLQDAALRYLDSQSQGLDRSAQRLGRPSMWLARQQQQLQSQNQRLRYAVSAQVARRIQHVDTLQAHFPSQIRQALVRSEERLQRAGRGLALLDPKLVLQRGYAWITDTDGMTVVDAAQVQPKQALRATLAKGQLDLTVQSANRAAPR